MKRRVVCCNEPTMTIQILAIVTLGLSTALTVAFEWAHRRRTRN